jgi:hypothetical protein
MCNLIIEIKIGNFTKWLLNLLIIKIAILISISIPLKKHLEFEAKKLII